ncbi:hypothetical protein PCIT_a0195 [Pseudoalteromonas citrea]|uniref:Uncharacterized protein n=1 Tax=Pseudoalteromonas citrea TaxID=43655 RepID=A0AAD4FSV7_9GAMM|nr:hypothetical protein PCIT_a0195 [Pseudoalteromonas citrea]
MLVYFAALLYSFLIRLFGPVYGSGDALYIIGEWHSSRLLLT